MGNQISENETITTNKTFNEYANKYVTSINNIQNTINETINKTVTNVNQKISNNSIGDNSATVINKVTIGGDLIIDNTTCPGGESAFDYTTDIKIRSELSAVQKSYQDIKTVEKLKQEIKSDLKLNTDLEDKIKNELNNALEAITKAEKEPGFAAVAQSIAGQKTSVESNNDTINKIKNEIQKYVNNVNNITNKMQDITDNTVNQVNNSSCQLFGKSVTDNTFEVKKSATIKCGNALKHRTAIISDIYANCYQTGQISQEFIKDFGLTSDAISDFITKNKNDTSNETKNESKASTESKEKDALAETVKTGINTVGDVAKTGIDAGASTVKTYLIVVGIVVIVIILVVGAFFLVPMLSGNKPTTSANNTASSLADVASSGKNLLDTGKMLSKMLKKGGGISFFNNIINFINENKWLFVLLIILLLVKKDKNSNIIETDIHYVRTPKFNIQLIR